MIHEKSCGAIIYTNVNGERLYLVEQMLDGHWGVPKGHVEENETEEETAVREIKEEVGLQVIIDSGFRMTETYSPKDGFIKDVVYFVAYSESMDTTMQAEEVQNIRWVKLEEAKELLKPHLKKVMHDNQLQMVFFMLTDILNESSELLCCGAGARKCILDAYDIPEDNEKVMLKGVVSRKKQLIPALVSTLQQ